MGDTRQNVPIPAGEYLDLYAATGIAVGTRLRIENTGVCDVQLSVVAAQPPVNTEKYNIVKRNGDPLLNTAGDSGAWAYCQGEDGELNVSVASGEGFFPENPAQIILYDINGQPYTVQNPLPTDGDSVYTKDVWVSESDTAGWVDADGAGGDLALIPFNNLHTALRYVGATNPKVLLIHFNRTVNFFQVGLGCADHPGENFSNTKVEVIGSGDDVRVTVDESANNTKYTSRNFVFGPNGGNAVRLSFATGDDVCLSNISIQKVTNVAAQNLAIQEDGTVVPVSATNHGNLKVAIHEYGDTPSIDAFARLRISEPFTLFDSKQLHDKQPLFWDEALGGSATSTHVPADAATQLVVTANAADYAIRQTKQRFNYQPGKSQLILLTFRTAQDAAITTRVGVFDGTGTNSLTPNNGIFFECNGGVSWNIAKNGAVTEQILQAAWNVDTLDGSGDEGNPSRVEIDPDATQILIIDYEWLGVGRVRVGFVIDGIVRYTHYFNHANDSTFTAVYMSTPNLPVRYSIQTDGAGGSQLDHICSTVISEGGIEKTGILRSVENNAGYVSGYAATTKYALVGIRLKALYADITVIPEDVTIILGSNDSFKWELHINPTINGTFTYNSLVDSSVEFAQGATTNDLSADGLIVARGGGSTTSRTAEAELKTALRIGSTIAGVADTMVLVIYPFSANTSAWAALGFRELL